MTQYPISQTTLDNGLRVVVSPDHSVPAVAVNLWYDVGSRHEEAGRTGFAHLFEHLMFQGSEHVASAQHLALMQAQGASVNATTWFDRTNYFEALPVGGLDLALWLEADRMGTLLSAVNQENLDNQREVVKEEKRQRYDNVPYGDLMIHLCEVVFPQGHPYAHTTIGSMEDLNAASVEDVHRFFTTHYRPNNAVLSLVGDLTPEQGFAKAAEYFGEIPAGPVPPAPQMPPLEPLAEPTRVRLTREVPAALVALGWRVPQFGDPALDAVSLALDILGGGTQSARLYRLLVRDTERAESVSASALGLIGGNSLAVVNARARDGVPIDDLTAEIGAEITRLAEEGPTAEEMRRAKAQFERAWLESLAEIATRADQLSAYATLVGDPERVNARLAEVNAVTADQVREATSTWLNPDRAAGVVYLPTASPEEN
ncbi:M16 family metallopeptidase [Granulicoccus phenolivorans]|uniref:M16 family metallopeptidase n=1 Tax=Granulicoccus phenolivorans TaxID=266854 RepID=UPI0003FBF8A7|nr:pitrilysin family protein [Granulicoccus phenolivorans]